MDVRSISRAAFTTSIVCLAAAVSMGQARPNQAKNETPSAPAAQKPAPAAQKPAAPTTKPATATQKPGNATAVQPAAPRGAPPTTGIVAPPDYVIGPDDQLTVVFWREKDLSAEVQVRPDGKISLPLINEVHAAGLTPEQLRLAVTAAAAKLVEEPTVTIMVKQINSRRVFITGQVAKPGPYPLMGPTTVLQLITIAGGLAEYADGENIGIIRTEGGKQSRLRFNYKDVMRGRNLQQNIELRPGDQILVP